MDKGGIGIHMGMKVLEGFLTSSVLIVVVLILRRLCRGKISLCLQYGIWLIVAVKLLLVPVPFWESPFSIMNLVGMGAETSLSAENAAESGVPGTDTNTESTYVFAEPEAARKYIGEEKIIVESIHSFTPEETQHSFTSTEKGSLEISQAAECKDSL